MCLERVHVKGNLVSSSSSLGIKQGGNQFKGQCPVWHPRCSLWEGVIYQYHFRSCIVTLLFFFFFVFFVVVVVAISWAAPAAYRGSQARGQIGAVATGLLQSHSNVGSELRLQLTPQPTATPDR